MVTDIFDAMRRMQREMDNVFARFHNEDVFDVPQLTAGQEPSRYHSPLTDIVEKTDAYAVTLDMPGVDKKDIDIEVDDRGVTISAQRKHEAETEQDGVYRMERRYSGFKRRVPLPDNADADNAQASYEDGVLTISVPKREELAQKKRIDVE